MGCARSCARAALGRDKDAGPNERDGVERDGVRFPVRKSKNVIAMPEGSDARPEHLGTVEASAKARPPWPGYAGATGRPQRSAPYAPQPTASEGELLLAALAKGPELHTEAEGALVVCRVRYSGNPDQGFKALAGATAPDLDVELSLTPGLPQLTLHGPEDRHEMFLALPLMTLKKTGHLRLHVYDRDELGRDDLGEVGMDAAAWPTRATRGDLTADCAAADREQVEVALTKALTEADKALSALGNDPQIMPADPTFGVGGTEGALARAVEPAARLVGWADPRVQRRLTWAERVRGALLEQARAQIEADWAKASHEADVFTGSTKLRTEVLAFSCAVAPKLGSAVQFQLSPEERQQQLCEISVSVRNVGPESVHAKAFFGDFFPMGWKPVLALADGTTTPARLVGIKKGEAEEAEDGSVDPTEQAVLRFIANATAGQDGATKARLFIAHGAGGVVDFRLPAVAAAASTPAASGSHSR
jgi:hypothetical protein